jgi:hypothetical protein
VKAFPGMKVCARAAVIVLIATAVSGCAASGYDAGALKSRLVSAGLSRAAATCVVDHMGPRFGDTRLGVHGDPTPAELKAERALLKACGVKS